MPRPSPHAAAPKQSGLTPVLGPDGKPLKRGKYRNQATLYNGVRYPSKAEAKRAEELDLLVRAGVVLFWVGQPVFRLGCPENRYVADFLVVNAGGPVHVEDVKGKRTQKFARDARLWKAYGPCRLYVIAGKKTQVIEPIGGDQ